MRRRVRKPAYRARRMGLKAARRQRRVEDFFTPYIVTREELQRCLFSDRDSLGAV